MEWPLLDAALSRWPELGKFWTNRRGAIALALALAVAAWALLYGIYVLLHSLL